MRWILVLLLLAACAPTAPEAPEQNLVLNTPIGYNVDIEYGPLPDVSEGDPFFLVVTVTNTGTKTIPAEGAVVSLSGLEARSFGLAAQPKWERENDLLVGETETYTVEGTVTDDFRGSTEVRPELVYCFKWDLYQSPHCISKISQFTVNLS